MKINLKDEVEMKEQLQKLMAEMKGKGYQLPHIADFLEDFRKFVQNPETVEMHVFTDAAEVEELVLEDTFLGKEAAKQKDDILRKLEKVGFCIGVNFVKKKARSQSRSASASVQ